MLLCPQTSRGYCPAPMSAAGREAHEGLRPALEDGGESAQCRSCGAEGGIPQKLRPKGSRAFQLWGILLAQGLVQNKGQSVLCIPNGNVDSPLHTGPPVKCHRSWSGGPRAAGAQESRQRVQAGITAHQAMDRSRSEPPCHCPERGTAQPLKCAVPRAEALVSSPLRDGSAAAAPPAAPSEAWDTGEGQRSGQFGGLGSQILGPFLALPLPGCVVLGMLFSLLLNLNFLICETGKILAPNSQDCVSV